MQTIHSWTALYLCVCNHEMADKNHIDTETAQTIMKSYCRQAVNSLWEILLSPGCKQPLRHNKSSI